MELFSILFHKDALRITGRFIERMFGERKDILYSQSQEEGDLYLDMTGGVQMWETHSIGERHNDTMYIH